MHVSRKGEGATLKYWGNRAATAQAMTFPTFLTSNPLSIAGKLIGMVALSFLFGQEIGGVSGGLAGAISGMIVAVVGQFVSHRAVLKKQRTDGAISLDQERDLLMTRANNVHQREVAFMQRQVEYHEQLESVARERLHAIVGEFQRCVGRIRILEGLLEKKEVEVPVFTFKRFDEIVEMYQIGRAH